MAKRFRSDSACFLCEKASNPCDGQRPCGRCVGLGIAHMCSGGGGGAPSTYDTQQTQQTQQQSSFTPSQSPPSSSSSSSHHPFSHSSQSPQGVGAPSSSSTNTQQHQQHHQQQQQHQQQHHQQHHKQPQTTTTITTVTAPTTTATTTSLVPTPATNIISYGSPQTRGNLSEAGRRQPSQSPSQTPQTTQALAPIGSSFGTVATRTSLSRPRDEIPLSQLNMNNYILSEIRKIKEDNRRLQEELLAVKLENLKLSSMFLTDQTVPNMSTALACTRPRPREEEDMSEKPMVVYDLRHRPPTILTTNFQFCNLVGYSMDEIIGSPWQKYIHHDYIDRTMAFLSQRAKSPYIHIEQIYKHKDGHIFPTRDKHVLLHDPTGNLVADTVTIIPLPAPSHPHSHSHSHSDSVGESLTGKEFPALPFYPGTESPKEEGIGFSTATTSSPYTQQPAGGTTQDQFFSSTDFKSPLISEYESNPAPSPSLSLSSSNTNGQFSDDGLLWGDPSFLPIDSPSIPEDMNLSSLSNSEGLFSGRGVGEKRDGEERKGEGSSSDFLNFFNSSQSSSPSSPGNFINGD